MDTLYCHARRQNAHYCHAFHALLLPASIYFHDSYEKFQRILLDFGKENSCGLEVLSCIELLNFE